MNQTAKRFIFILLALALMAPAQPSGKTSVAVYPIKASGATDKSIASALTSLLGFELTQSQKLIVIKEDMLQEVMKRQAMNQSDLCDSSQCQVEIGKLVAAQKMVNGEIIKMGTRYIMTINLIDIQTGAQEFSAKDQCTCTDDQVDLLASAAGAKIRNFYGEAVQIPQLPGGATSAAASAPAVSKAELARQAREQERLRLAQEQEAARQTKEQERLRMAQAQQLMLGAKKQQQVAVLTKPPAPAPVPAAPLPPLKSFQEYNLSGTQGGPMVYVSDFKFYIDKFEVTNQDYEQCVQAGACKKNKQYKEFTGEKQPVVGVGQEDARNYCAWAGKRLPTDDEWTKAASAGDGRAYPWGDQPPDCNLAHYQDCKVPKTEMVGSKPYGYSPYGALDMSGNVYEWVEEESVLRGGSWFNNGKLIKASARTKDDSISGLAYDWGFRCAHQ